MSEATLLDIRGLTVSYRIAQETVPVFKDFSLAIAPAAIVGISGDSGSGKTTLAKAILRLLPRSGSIDGGSVRFGGTDLLSLSEAQMVRFRGRRIGMIFQEPGAALNPLMTLGTQLAEPLRLHFGLSRREAETRLLEGLVAVGIDDGEARLKLYPHEVSTGQQQRALLAAAVACRPELLICDEPLAAVDPPNRRRTLELLEQLREQHSFSILLISHDLQVLQHFCDEVRPMPGGSSGEAGEEA